jgi:hypothetical protein
VRIKDKSKDSIDRRLLQHFVANANVKLTARTPGEQKQARES